MSSAAKLAALVRLYVGFLQQFHVSSRGRRFPWDSLFRNYFVCFPEFSTANRALALARDDRRLVNVVLVLLARWRRRLQIEMGNDLAVQETRSRRIPEVLQSLRCHDGSQALQQSDVIFINLVLPLALLLQLLQLGGDVRVVVGRIKVNCRSGALNLFPMLMEALKLPRID